MMATTAFSTAFSATGLVRRIGRGLAALGATAALSACDPAALTGGGGGDGAPAQVALLVPAGSSDGNVAFLAQNLTNAARLAVADLQGANVDLRVYDTAGNAQRAVQVATQAVNEGADIVIGPLFAENANAVGVALAQSDVSVMSFSNNPSVAGGNVFVMGPTFDNTARRLMEYARRQGIGTAYVVNGNSPGEISGRDALVSAASDNGIRVVGTTSFQMSQEGVGSAVPGIVAQAETADALLLTSTTDGALPFLTRLLPENGLPPSAIQYVGLTRWDVPASALSLPGVQGGWFAIPDTRAVSEFSSRYAASYGSAPHSIAGLGYDGIAVVGALQQAGRPLTPSNIRQSRGFAGASGAFRFLDTNATQRALSIATVENQTVRILDSAPSRFGIAGF